MFAFVYLKLSEKKKTPKNISPLISLFVCLVGMLSGLCRMAADQKWWGEKRKKNVKININANMDGKLAETDLSFARQATVVDIVIVLK